MSKKYVSSLLLLSLLTGCYWDEYHEESVTIQKPTTTVTPEAEQVEEAETSSKAYEKATEIVEQLQLQDTMDKPLVEGAIKGLFFQGDDSKYTDACVYLSNIAGNSNTVAVFQTNNSNDVKASLQTYLESAEANAQEYFGEEVNKIKNALLDSNDKYVVLVIADDMEQAKNIVEKILK